jgi:hypothetical protein
MDMPPTLDRATAYNDYIQALMDNGLWDDLGALFIFSAEDFSDACINVLSPSDAASHCELALGTEAFAWESNVGLKLSGQSQTFGYVRTKWAQNAMPGFNRDTVAYGVMQNGSNQADNTNHWADDSANAGTILISGAVGVSVDKGNLSQTAITLGNQSSGVVAAAYSSLAMIRTTAGATTDYSINGAAFQHVGATAKGSLTTHETEKRAWYALSAAPDTQRVAIAFAFKIVTNAQIALMNSLSKTFLEAIEVPGWVSTAESLTLFAAMTTQPSAARRTLIDNTINDLMDAGVWSKLGVLYLLAAHDSQAGRLNWKSPAFGLLTVVPGGVLPMGFAADGGFTGNGQVNANAAYLEGVDFDTVPGLLQNSGHQSIYATSEGDGQGGGVFDARNFNEFPAGGDANGKIVAKSVLAVSEGSGRINGSGVMASAASSFVRGQYLTNRSGATAAQFYRDGVLSSTDATASTALVSSNFSFLASWVGFTWASREPRIGAASIGVSLNATEVTALYTALSAYLSAVGAIP